MKIIFVVNTLGLTGGIKVILEYANRLQSLGHEIKIVHLLRLENNLRGLVISLLKKVKYILRGLSGKAENIGWFPLSKEIKVLHLIFLDKIKNYDAVVATANETADWVAVLSETKGKKFYFVQDYEDWTREKEKVDNTYRLPLKKITTSSWLKNILVNKFNESVVGVVPCGVDAFFRCKNKRYNKKRRLLMQYHILSKKGFDIGFEAFMSIKNIFPEIEMSLFGAYLPKKKLPKEIKFYYCPKLDQLKWLYCSSDIFIFSSLEEGFGLPPMEAMAAQCAVIATDVGGIRDYAINGKTAVIVPPGDSQAIADAAIDLLKNEEKLKKIAIGGHEYIKKFTWKKAAKELENILLTR